MRKTDARTSRFWAPSLSRSNSSPNSCWPAACAVASAAASDSSVGSVLAGGWPVRARTAAATRPARASKPKAGRQQRVQVLHGARVADGQPPGQIALGLAEDPQRGQGHGELGGPGAGKRAEVTEHEPVPVGRGQGERHAAGDQELAGPVGQQRRQRGVADGPQARLAGHVVVEVVQDNHVALGGLGGQAGRRDLSADHGDDPLGRQPAHPRRDLAGEGRLTDSAQAVNDQRGHARLGQVAGPAPPFGGPDRQRGVLGAGRPGRSGVARRVFGPGRLLVRPSLGLSFALSLRRRGVVRRGRAGCRDVMRQNPPRQRDVVMPNAD